MLGATPCVVELYPADFSTLGALLPVFKVSLQDQDTAQKQCTTQHGAPGTLVSPRVTGTPAL